MKNNINLLLIITFIFSPIVRSQNSSYLEYIEPLAIGDKIKIHSDVLNEERIINIYLPHSYSEDLTREYPVIYLLDGSIDEDFIHIAGIVQFGSYSWINFVPESIVVGISNIDRKRDFTFPDKRRKKVDKNYDSKRHSGDFINFIDNELIPLITKRYRMSSESTIIGQSLGGLLVSEILIKKPHIFDNYIIISPSLWWDNASLLKLEPTNCLSKKTVYIGVGKEGRLMEQSAKVMYEKFRDLNRSNFTVYYEYFDDLDHSNILHLGIYKAFNVIFKSSEKQKVVD